MFLRTSNWAVMVGAALASAALWRPAAPADAGVLGPITLNNCEVELRPSSGMGTTEPKEADVFYEESSSGVGFWVFPEQNVAIAAADARGLNEQPLKWTDAMQSNNKNVLKVTYMPGLPIQMKLEIDKDGDGTVDKWFWLPVRPDAVFDPYAELAVPYLEEAGVVPGTTDKKRVRVMIDYYGIETFFTLIDQ